LTFHLHLAESERDYEEKTDGKMFRISDQNNSVNFLLECISEKNYVWKHVFLLLMLFHVIYL